MLMLVSMTLTLMQRQWVGKSKTSVLKYFDIYFKQATGIKLATTVDHFLRYVTWIVQTFIYYYGLTILFLFTPTLIDNFHMIRE